MAPEFSVELLKAVNDWQAGSKNKRRKADKIAKVLNLHPVEPFLLKCDVPCFRRSVLENAALKSLFFDFCVEEETSSWTTVATVASTFKGGPPDPPRPGVIFRHTPKKEEVVLNLERLYQHPMFWPSVQLWEAEGVDFGKGIRRYTGLQREVILNVENVPHDEIYAFGSNAAFDLANGVFEDVPLIGESSLTPDELTKVFSEAGMPLKRWTYGEAVPRIYANWIRRVLKRLDVELPGAP